MCNSGGKKTTNEDDVISVYYNAVFLQFIQLHNVFGAIHKETFQSCL